MFKTVVNFISFIGRLYISESADCLYWRLTLLLADDRIYVCCGLNAEKQNKFMFADITSRMCGWCFQPLLYAFTQCMHYIRLKFTTSNWSWKSVFLDISFLYSIFTLYVVSWEWYKSHLRNLIGYVGPPVICLCDIVEIGEHWNVFSPG